MSLGNYSKLSMKSKHNRKGGGGGERAGLRSIEQERSAKAIIKAIRQRKANGTYGQCAA